MTEHTPTTGALVPRTPRVLEGAVALSGEQPADRPADTAVAMVWIPGEGQAVRIARDELPPEFFNPRLLPAYQPRDLAPQPAADPIAQRIAAGGIGLGAAGAGLGWGLGQAAAGITATGGGGLVLGALLGLLLARLGSGGSTTTVHHEHHETHVTTHNRGLARSVTTTGIPR
ncbi:hypothetical protein [Streptodolium elevatio]|uniref:Uncharacterized protein n=1 Tax=Streptodolium elevatio TaxID=3157996 RepID=A0ABV3DU63_9ACTN